MNFGPLAGQVNPRRLMPVLRWGSSGLTQRLAAVVVGTALSVPAAQAFAAGEKSQSTSQAPKLAVVGGVEKPRGLLLGLAGQRVDERPPMRDKTSLTGDLHLALRNSGDAPAQIRIQYARQQGQRVISLPGASRLVTLAAVPYRSSRWVELRGRRAGAALRDAARRGDPNAPENALAAARAFSEIGAVGPASSKTTLAPLAKALRGLVSQPRDAALSSVVSTQLIKAWHHAGVSTSGLSAATVTPIVNKLSTPADKKVSVAQVQATLSELNEALERTRLPVVPSRSVRQLNLHFTVAADQPASLLDGTLDLEVFGGKGSQPATVVSVPVVATPRPIGGVTFEPTKAVLQLTRFCLGCDLEGDTTVRVVGSGVGDLISTMNGAGVDRASVLLEREGRDDVLATLSGLAPDSHDPNAATGEVVLGGTPGAGLYTGKIPLTRASANSPALPVAVRSRVWFPVAVLFISLGAIFAGWLLVHFGLARRRKLLRDALKGAVDDYAAAINTDNSGGATSIVWELDIALPLVDDPKWQYYDPLSSATSIYTAAKWARNDADLDEVETKALELITQIRAWVLALKATGALQDLSKVGHEPADAWARTRVVRDTDMVLRRATRRPADDAAAQELSDRIDQQTRWHRSFAQAWDLRNHLVIGGGTSAAAAADVGLMDLDQTATPATTRTADEQDALDRELDRLYAELQRLSVSTELVGAEGGPTVEVLQNLSTPEIAERRSELHLLRRFSGPPQQALAALRHGRAGVQPGEPEESGLAEGAADPADMESAQRRTLGERARTAVSLQSPRQALLKRNRVDLVVSLITVVVMSVVYALTVYDDTWGSLADLATAFTAGVAGNLVIKWAVLPIYRSVRLRTPVPAPAPAAIPVVGE